jgi:hypothetical protein
MASRPRITLANLKPAPGSQHNVNTLLYSLGNLAADHQYHPSQNVLEEVKDLVMEERRVVVPTAKSLVRVLE